MTDRKRKSTVIVLSSSSEEEEEDDDGELEEEEEEEVDEEICTSGNGGDLIDENEEESYSCDVEEENGSDHDGEDGGGGGGENEESLSKRVIRLLKEGSDLEALQLRECKAYLRMYGLRLAGTKAVCIQRIKEHFRIKDGDGDGDVFYPRSSFVINCRGDVCKGDVVLFSQKVYESFDKVTRHGKLVGRRTVAGRVIKESYGSAKQQHTFTVEVLWSKGIKQLPPLFPLLVKGRNLYRLKTFRQRWDNEAERIKILAEKHKRGTVARLVRARKKSKRMGSPNRGLKQQRCSNYTRPFQMGKTADLARRNDFKGHRRERRKNVKGHRKGTLQHSTEFNNHGQEPLPSRHLKCTRTNSSEGLNSSRSYLKDGHRNNDMGPNNQSSSSLHNQYFPLNPFESMGGPMSFSGYGMVSPATGTEFPPFRDYARSGMRNLDHFREWNDADRPNPFGMYNYPDRIYQFPRHTDVGRKA